MVFRFLFRKEKSPLSRAAREEKLERALADGFRTLADLFRKSADVLEARRLERKGYEKQEKFLERSTPPKGKE
jgi:hypothetical protein